MNELPDEVMARVFEALGPTDVWPMRGVTRGWRLVADVRAITHVSLGKQVPADGELLPSIGEELAAAAPLLARLCRLSTIKLHWCIPMVYQAPALGVIAAAAPPGVTLWLVGGGSRQTTAAWQATSVARVLATSAVKLRNVDVMAEDEAGALLQCARADRLQSVHLLFILTAGDNTRFLELAAAAAAHIERVTVAPAIITSVADAMPALPAARSVVVCRHVSDGVTEQETTRFRRWLKDLPALDEIQVQGASCPVPAYTLAALEHAAEEELNVVLLPH